MINRSIQSVFGLSAWLAIFFLFSVRINAQTTVSMMPDRAKIIGDTLHVPIHLTGTGILNMAFYIDYDHLIMEPFSTPYMNVIFGLSVTGYNPEWQAGTMALFIDAFGLEGFNYANDRIITLVFTLKKVGETSLTFRTNPLPWPTSKIWNEIGIPFGSVNYSGPNITVLPEVPSTRIIQNETVQTGETACYDATQTIIVAGNGSTFVVEPGGQATFVAGQNIIYLPGTRVEQGGYMHGYITLNHQYCGTNAPVPSEMITSGTGAPEDQEPIWTIYPNPTGGELNIDVRNLQQQKFYTALYDLQGNMIRTSEMFASGRPSISLSDRPAGVYFLRLIWDQGYKTVKIIKN